MKKDKPQRTRMSDREVQIVTYIRVPKRYEKRVRKLTVLERSSFILDGILKEKPEAPV